MYFLTSLTCTVIAGILFFTNRKRKGLHLDILTITFGAATLMWLVDCIYSAAGGEGFLSFETTDGWIALWTVLGGIGFWMVVSFVLNNSKKTELSEEKTE